MRSLPSNSPCPLLLETDEKDGNDNDDVNPARLSDCDVRTPSRDMLRDVVSGRSEFPNSVAQLGVVALGMAESGLLGGVKLVRRMLAGSLRLS